MAVTRTISGLRILSYTVRSDGVVSFLFALDKAGLWCNIPAQTTAIPPGSTQGFPMTPATWDSAHATDPLVVLTPGQTFLWLWDANADGFAQPNYDGWKFSICYYDKHCDEEPEPRPTPVPANPPVPPQPPAPPPMGPPAPPPPPPAPPPPPPPPPPPAPPPAGPPAPSGPPVVPDPVVPVVPGDDVLPGRNPDGTSNGGGGTLPPPPGWPYDEDDYGDEPPGWPDPWPWPPFGEMPSDWPLNEYPQWPPYPGFPWPPLRWGDPWPLPPGFYTDPGTGLTFDENGNIIDPGTLPSTATARVFPWEEFERRRVSSDDEIAEDGSQDIGEADGKGDNVFDYKEFEEFDFTPQATPSTFADLVYTAPEEEGPFVLHGDLLPTVVMNTEKSMAFIGIENNNLTASEDLYVGAEFIDGDGRRWLVSPLTAIGSIPAEGVKGISFHIHWDHAAPGPGVFAAFVSLADEIPIVAKKMPFEVVSQEGDVDQDKSQVPPQHSMMLSHDVIRIARFQDPEIKPSHSGLVDTVGLPETFNFIAQDWVSLVVKTTWQAKESGFVPRLRIYSADEPTVAVVDTTSRLLMGELEIEDHTHSVGWAGDTLTPGQQYFFTVTNEALAQDPSWQFFVFHEQGPWPFSSTLAVGGDGFLEGGFGSCVGRWVRIQGQRGVFLDLKPNALGDVDDVRTRVTPSGDLLPVEAGERILVLSRGFMGDFNEAFNLIEEVTL